MSIDMGLSIVQWRGRLHSYMWVGWDGMDGWMDRWMDGIGYHRS